MYRLISGATSPTSSQKITSKRYILSIMRSSTSGWTSGIKASNWVISWTTVEETCMVTVHLLYIYNVLQICDATSLADAHLIYIVFVHQVYTRKVSSRASEAFQSRLLTTDGSYKRSYKSK
jgi:hypothetical protein